VAGERLLRILALLVARGSETTEANRLCEVAADVTGTSGAGIMLMSGHTPLGSLGCTDDVSALIGDLQYTLGEGPCVDSYTLGGPVLEADLADPTVPRWPVFTPPAVTAGVRAVFGFPIRVGAARLGALDLYRDRPGPLSGEQHADALVMADVAARSVLATQAGAAPGTLAAELEADASFKLVVHQAAGMVSVQLDISVADALVRLRARAFRTDRAIANVAEDVVARRLRFSESDDR
jgi:hypothetical protein